MKQFSKLESESLLSRLYWDVEIEPERLIQLLNGRIDKIGHIDRNNLYYRILTSYDWYTILKLLPGQMLKEALNDSVINRIHIKDLKDKYFYARQFLS